MGVVGPCSQGAGPARTHRVVVEPNAGLVDNLQEVVEIHARAPFLVLPVLLWGLAVFRSVSQSVSQSNNHSVK